MCGGAGGGGGTMGPVAMTYSMQTGPSKPNPAVEEFWDKNTDRMQTWRQMQICPTIRKSEDARRFSLGHRREMLTCCSERTFFSIRTLQPQQRPVHYQAALQGVAATIERIKSAYELRHIFVIVEQRAAARRDLRTLRAVLTVDGSDQALPPLPKEFVEVTDFSANPNVFKAHQTLAWAQAMEDWLEAQGTAGAPGPALRNWNCPANLFAQELTAAKVAQQNKEICKYSRYPTPVLASKIESLQRQIRATLRKRPLAETAGEDDSYSVHDRKPGILDRPARIARAVHRLRSMELANGREAVDTVSRRSQIGRLGAFISTQQFAWNHYVNHAFLSSAGLYGRNH